LALDSNHGRRTAGESRIRSRFPRPVVVALLFVAALIVGGRHPLGAAAATTVVKTEFAAVADSYVNASDVNANYGSNVRLRTTDSPVMRSYLRFEVSGLSGTLSSARLRLHVALTSGGSVSVAPVTAPWDERTVTFANSPRGGTAVASSGRLKNDTWTALDVGSLIDGDGTYSFVVRGTGGTRLNSRESGTTYAARLAISTTQLADVSPPTVPQGLTVGNLTGNEGDLGWSTSVDDVGVEAYDLFLDGSFVGSTSAATYHFSSLRCGATQVLGVAARDAAGNRSETATVSVTTPGCSARDDQPAFPIRAAFYYPWFPETWTVGGYATHYHPVAGYYSSTTTSVIQQQVQAMQYGGIQAGIISWWGPGTASSDARVPAILSATAGSAFRWAFYYEAESTGNPTASQIAADLQYLENSYGTDPSVLRVNGRMVVFVYADGTDGCGMADRWAAGNTVNAYVVLKVFGGYTGCAAQPDGWHQYSPAVRADAQSGYSYSISPGFWKANESAARLQRDPTAFGQAVRNMVASNAPWQLVTTFNEWGEGTAVEDADSTGYATPNLGTGAGWQSASGYGTYLDLLHADGAPGDSEPPTAPSSIVASSATATTISLSWSESSDNVGVSRYDVYQSGAKVASSSTTSASVGGLSCGTAYSFGVEAVDLSGNPSSRTAATLSTAACPSDVQAPTAPGALSASGVLTDQVTLSWTPSTDDRGVKDYRVYVNGSLAATVAGPPTTLTSLQCATTYTLAVEARDAAGNVSPRAETAATTAACPPSPPASGPCNARPTPPATYQHVIWIWFENHTYSSVLGGNSSAPYFNWLASSCGYSIQWMDNLFSYNSEPEYLAGVSGSNCDIGFAATGTNCNTGNDGSPSGSTVLTTSTLFDQVTVAGGTWKAYQEGMPGNCAFSSGGSGYAPKHNPPVFFATLTGGSHTAPAAGSPCLSRDVPIPALSCPGTRGSACSAPGGALIDDLANDTLPTFAFVTPNLCNDMHDCSPTVSDNWIHTYMDIILASPAYRSGSTAVFLMWDEGSFGAPQPNVIVSPSTDRVVSSTTMNNLAALGTTESMLGIGTRLGCASGTPPGGVGTCPSGSTVDLRGLFNL
jgi:chitodextrinase